MIPITIHSPIWHDRSISVRKDLILLAQKKNEALQVKIEAKPYSGLSYSIDPSKVLSIGKSWFIKGMELVNFKISTMEVINANM